MNIAAYIDHTILKPTTTAGEVTRLCHEAMANNFAAVCIPPLYTTHATQLLQDSNVWVATVIGFPFGYNCPNSKFAEIEDALKCGAEELDMVHNLTALKNKDWDALTLEVAACTKMIHDGGARIKVIIESGILTDQEIIKCCELYAPLGIDFMKTSTGYAETGATVHAVELMRKHLPENIAIKASGGIRSFAFAKELIDAGASRLGCSASLQIVKESNE